MYGDGDSISLPEGTTTSEVHEELKRRFYEQASKPRTSREQFEIDREKALWAGHLAPKH